PQIIPLSDFFHMPEYFGCQPVSPRPKPATPRHPRTLARRAPDRAGGPQEPAAPASHLVNPARPLNRPRPPAHAPSAPPRHHLGKRLPQRLPARLGRRDLAPDS